MNPWLEVWVQHPVLSYLRVLVKKNQNFMRKEWLDIAEVALFSARGQDSRTKNKPCHHNCGNREDIGL